MRLSLRLVLLIVFWLLAWGEISVANVVSGIVLASALLVAFPPRRRTTATPRISPVGVVRLLVFLLGQLVTSNVLVAREIVSRRSRVRAGVLAHPVQHPSDEVISLITHIIALTPGTMTVEATREPAVIYVHFLLLSDIDRARRGVARIERLAAAALGVPDGPATPPEAAP